MLDVNKIIATLRGLDDASLQRYAQMHKDDPYTLSLAVQESNVRKQMRAASQPAAPNAAPVADQAIAGMAQAPEEMGLAQIPMQSEPVEMAGGGLLAFAAGTDEPIEEPEQLSGPGYLPPGSRLRTQQSVTTERRGNVAQAGLGGIPVDTAALTLERERALREARAAQGESPETVALRQLGDEEAARARERYARYQAAKPKEPAAAGLEAALKREAEAEPQARKDNMRMALLEAGLSMMAGPSQYAAQNIGAGALQGVKAYRTGETELTKAAKARDEVAARIEAARRAEARGDAKEAYEQESAADAILFRTRSALIEQAMKDRSLDRATATKLVDMEMALRREEIQQSGAMERTKVSAAATVSSAGASAARAGAAENRAALTALMNSLKQRQAAVAEQLKSGTAQYDPAQRAPLLAEQARITRDLMSVEQELRKTLGMPAPEATDTSRPGTTRLRFDAKGNPIQ